MYRRSWSDDQLKEAVRTSTTFAEVLRKLRLQVQPGNYGTIRKHIRRNKLDVSHMVGFAHGTSRHPNKRTAEEVFVQHSDYSRSALKKRLLKEGLLKNVCALCTNAPVWCSKPLVLVLDHVNGINDDDRIENLRLLCPNCNSQTATFCGRRRKKPRVYRRCHRCGERIGMKGKTGLCVKCSQVMNRKVERPSHKMLLYMVGCCGLRGTGKKYGVSDNAIKKWLRTDSANNTI